MILLFSRARVRAHYRRFCIFAVTSVTLYLQNANNQHKTNSHTQILTNQQFTHSKTQNLGNAKHIVTTSSFVYFSSFFRHHFTTNVTLVTAKKLNHCWNARAQHARVRLREKNFTFPTLSAPRPPTICYTSHHATNNPPN